MRRPEPEHDPGKQVQGYRRAMERNPGSLRFAEYADQLRQAGMLADATLLCARGLARHPGYATGHTVMGEIFLDQGLEGKAEREWREALRLDPTHPRAHLRLGQLYLARGKTDLAAAAFEAALLSQPDLAEAQAGLAKARGPQPPAQQMLDDGQERQWRAGGRPEWLTSDRLEELAERARRCEGVESAALANRDGLVLAGALPRGAQPSAGALAALRLIEESQNLLRRLGAGRLRGAALYGEGGGVRCVGLEDLALIVGVNSNVPPGSEQHGIEDILSSGDSTGDG